ncbi:hypothetical protein ACH495_27390 [Micromonospora sp. NPDC018662]
MSTVAVMTQHPSALRVTDDGRLHADGEPAVVWPDGSHLWARDSVVLPSE